MRATGRQRCGCHKGGMCCQTSAKASSCYILGGRRPPLILTKCPQGSVKGKLLVLRCRCPQQQHPRGQHISPLILHQNVLLSSASPEPLLVCGESCRNLADALTGVGPSHDLNAALLVFQGQEDPLAGDVSPFTLPALEFSPCTGLRWSVKQPSWPGVCEMYLISVKLCVSVG